MISRDRVATYSTEMSAERKDSMVVELRDTVREVTTITIRENAAGDTVKFVQITDLTRAKSRDAIATQRTKTEVRVDTVYVEKMDSVEVSRNYGATGDGDQKGGTFLRGLKWVFWIVVAVIVLVGLVKIKY